MDWETNQLAGYKVGAVEFPAEASHGKGMVGGVLDHVIGIISILEVGSSIAGGGKSHPTLKLKIVKG